MKPRSGLYEEIRSLRCLLSLLREYRWVIPVAATLGLLASILEGASLSLLIPLLNTLQNTGNSPFGKGRLAGALNAAIGSLPHGHELGIVLLAIFSAICLKNLVSYANVSLFAFVDSRVTHSLRIRLFERVLETPLVVAEDDPSGRLMNMLGTETWRTSEALGSLFNAITSGCTVIVFIPLLFLLSWRATLIALLVVGIIPIVIAVVTSGITALGRDAVTANTELATRMWSSLAGIRAIHTFGQQMYEMARFEQASRRARDISLKLSLIAARNGPAAEVMLIAIIAILVSITQIQMVDMARLTAFIVIVYRLQPRIREIISARGALLALQGAIFEVTDFAEMPDTKSPLASGKALPGRLSIGFEGVTFRYEKRDAPAIANVSFEIEPGTSVAIVGRSGAGKSTLLDLLQGFREPQQGRITIDGIPITELDVASWRSRIGVVSQEPFIFDETVRFNILYSRPEGNESELIEAATLARADGFISALPDGYNTVVGERGVRLSGGQKQRLVLARAILRNPDILLLDEATNALDSVTEEAFHHAMVDFGRRRTTIIVAHRLSTISRADKILVFDCGKLVEQGDFASLVRSGGLFAQMHQLQNRSITA